MNHCQLIQRRTSKAVSHICSSSSQLKKNVITKTNKDARLLASYNNNQTRLTHTIGEELIRPSILEAFKIANLPNAPSILATFPHSNSMISPRINDLPNKCQLSPHRTTKFSQLMRVFLKASLSPSVSFFMSGMMQYWRSWFSLKLSQTIQEKTS